MNCLRARSQTSAAIASVVWKLGAVLGFALLTAAAAGVRFHIPSTPVPVTLQTVVVLLAGMTLGPRLGLASMVLYLSLGSAGYHVFASQTFGIASLIGPTAGYLIGFAIAQPLIGVLSDRTKFAYTRFMAASVAGHAVIFACGLIGLRMTIAGSWSDAVALGLVPFLLPTLFKTVIAGGLGVPMQRIFDRLARS